MKNNNEPPRRSLKSPLERKENRRQILVHAIVWIVTFPVIYFFYYLIAESFTTSGAMKELQLGNWQFLISSYNVNTWTVVPKVWPILWQTLIFAISVTVLTIVFIVPCGYAFSRLEFKGRKFLLKAMFFLSTFPSSTMIIGIFFLLTYLGLTNTLTGVVLAKVAAIVPGQLYIMKGFFDDIPWDYEWAGMVDGCTRFQTFLQVILPSAGDGIGIVAINAFLSAYGEWFLFKILIWDTRYKTMARALQGLVTDDKVSSAGVLCAYALFYIVPIAIFYMLSQDQLLKMNNLGGKKLV